MKCTKNKRMLSKTLALFLAMLLSVGNLSVTAFAAETDGDAGCDMAITEVADITDAVFGSDDAAEADIGASAGNPVENPVDDGAETDPPIG